MNTPNAKERRRALARSPIITAVLLAAALAVGAFLAWQVIGVLLLIFAALVVSRIFSVTADLFHRYLKIPQRVALSVAVLLIVLLIVGFTAFVAIQLQSSVTQLLQRLPQDIEMIGEMFGIQNLTGNLNTLFQESGALWDILGLTGNFANVLTGILVVTVAAIFLAASPAPYRAGFLSLFPKHLRARIDRAIFAVSKALELWLVGKVLMMSIVFVATTPGLFLIGVPYALTLGILAGLLEFVPFFGPIIAAIPALLIALGEGGPMVFWVAGLYLVVQQFENNILIPMIQDRTIKLPPVVSLFAILLFSALFGVLGLLLAIPLTVVMVVLIKQLYIRDVLGDPVKLPGVEDDARD